MADIGHNSGDIGGEAAKQLLLFIERWERLDEEMRKMAEHIGLALSVGALHHLEEGVVSIRRKLPSHRQGVFAPPPPSASRRDRDLGGWCPALVHSA